MNSELLSDFNIKGADSGYDPTEGCQIAALQCFRIFFLPQQTPFFSHKAFHKHLMDIFRDKLVNTVQHVASNKSDIFLRRV